MASRGQYDTCREVIAWYGTVHLIADDTVHMFISPIREVFHGLGIM